MRCVPLSAVSFGNKQVPLLPFMRVVGQLCPQEGKRVEIYVHEICTSTQAPLVCLNDFLLGSI